MITLQQLQARLADWSKGFGQTVAAPSAPSILIYQALYALIHDLKATVQLSDDPAVNALTEPVLQADTCLRKLAYGELGLSAADNLALHGLACQLDSIPRLARALEKACAAATPLSPDDPAVLTQQYHWDGFSKARARCASALGFVFYEHRRTLELLELIPFDRQLATELRQCGGMAIVRRLDPLQAQSPGALMVELYQLAALPPSTKPAPGLTWARL